ncbi:hypothetical protein V6U81_01600 [Micromonospora sp. CPCC 205711]|uniref:hypothetical protein n=1 Tax=Micromonospora sp. CPCC 205547 TaxID=3122400 RepID=UPI002FEE7DA6
MNQTDCPPGHAELLAAQVLKVLGPADAWRPAPSGYPDSLALCILDAIWSMGVRYGAVENVVRRYRDVRRAGGGDVDRDGASDLLRCIETLHGADAFAERLRNRQRVSTHANAVRKAEAVHRAAQALCQAGVETVEDLRAATTSPDEARVKGLWLALPGQGSGISWHYLLMLAGLPGVKPDRMICRFVGRALGRKRVPPAEAACLVKRAAVLLDVSPTRLDHEIWRYER